MSSCVSLYHLLPPYLPWLGLHHPVCAAIVTLFRAAAPQLHSCTVTMASTHARHALVAQATSPRARPTLVCIAARPHIARTSLAPRACARTCSIRCARAQLCSQRCQHGHPLASSLHPPRVRDVGRHGPLVLGGRPIPLNPPSRH
jgi:hypothetical protein